MKIKVCGMTSIDQLRQLGALEVDFAGLIFYPKSQRYVLNFGLDGNEVKEEKLGLLKVGVFVNASYEEIVKQVDAFGLDAVQLHGDETPDDCARLSAAVKVIKAFRLSEGEEEARTRSYSDAADYFLFDNAGSANKTEKAYGGSGHKFNWNSLENLDSDKPFFLSGGIGPADAELIKGFMKTRAARDLFALDLNSRFETSPGIKDMARVKAIINAINS